MCFTPFWLMLFSMSVKNYSLLSIRYALSILYDVQVPCLAMHPGYRSWFALECKESIDFDCSCLILARLVIVALEG